jgi:hypothetical protein
MGWDPISQTTLSRFFWVVLSKTGVLGMNPSLLIQLNNIHPLSVFNSCTAHHSNLDGEAGPRSKEHRQQAIDCLGLGELWDDYGIVGDIIVSLLPSEKMDTRV